jgi:Na+/melibiose symporter-like transporter
MVGKSVRFDRRGRSFATRQVIGGLLSVGAGAVVAAILEADRFAFPTNYGVVIAIAAAIYLANVATVVGLVERPSKTSERLDVPTLIRRLPHYLRANPAFARTMLVLVLFNMARLSMPFYIVYGRQTLGLAAAAVGIVIAAQMAGRVAGAMLWGYLGDRHGHERAVRGGTIAAAVPALLALGFAALPVGPVITVAYALLFFVLGMSLEGWPPFINYMLAIVPEDERPMYAGLMGVGYVPAAVAPIVGGVLVSLWDYSGVFLVTAVLTGAGAAASLWLRSEAQPLAGATERPDSRNDAG